MSRKLGFILFAAGLAFVMGISLLQYRHSQQLKESSNFGRDSAGWDAYYLEREYFRLTQVMGQMLNQPNVDNTERFFERFDIFISRIDLIELSPVMLEMRNTPEYKDLHVQLDLIIPRIDALLEQWRAQTASEPTPWQMNSTALNQAQLLQLSQIYNALIDSELYFREFTNENNLAAGRFLDYRNSTIRDKNRTITFLTIGLSLLLLGVITLLSYSLIKQRKDNVVMQQMTQKLLKSTAQAESANKAKSSFLATMSHEVRTPFQGLLGMLNLLSDTPLNDVQRDYTQTAHDSAQHLLSIVSDLLDISTIESGVLKLAPVKTDLHALLREITTLSSSLANQKNLTFHAQIDPNLAPWVMVDPKRLRQILFNLINNAIKFTEKGSVSLIAYSTPNYSVFFEVEDTGIGIESTALEHLFSRFYQANNSIIRRYGGTGLGLEISQNLAHLMGGQIQVTSEPSVGSIFKVALPLPICDAPIDESVENTDLQPAYQQGLRFLVVDDYEINLKFLRILLEKMGHSAHFFNSGQALIDYLTNNPEQTDDVILMDLHMPNLDGINTTLAMRELPSKNAQIPVILLTADITDEVQQRASFSSINLILNKPLKQEDLIQALRKLHLLNLSDTAQKINHQVSQHNTLSSTTTIEPLANQSNNVINYTTYRELCDLMPASSIAKMMHELYDATHGVVPRIQRALAQGALDTAGEISHQVKGITLLLGFTSVSQALSDIEMHTLKQKQAPPLQLITHLQTTLLQTQQILQTSTT